MHEYFMAFSLKRKRIVIVMSFPDGTVASAPVRVGIGGIFFGEMFLHWRGFLFPHCLVYVGRY